MPEGKYMKARPTIYKGIQMRSRLEAGFAGWLDRSHLAWEYEPHAVGDERGQYLPDFLVRGLFSFIDDPQIWDAYLEIKPAWDAIDWDRLDRAAVQLNASYPDRVFFVVTPQATTMVSANGARMHATWVYRDVPGRSLEAGVGLTIAAFERPFETQWWG